MKTLSDPLCALAAGLAGIRAEFHVPAGFPPAVTAAAEKAARRAPSDHRDRTNMPFVTLDPASSIDLDQAFAIETSGSDLLLHYAIADVAWFVDDGDVIDQEAWRRGETLYLPDSKAGLYPPVLSEAAASLLPDGPRPAVIFTTRVDADGNVRLVAAERAMIRSRAKLAYESAGDSDLPSSFRDLARRVQAAEERRGAARVDPPEQEVARAADGSFKLVFRPRLPSEESNAALSLASNLAIADALHASHTGLFRVMGEPDAKAIMRLRHMAAAYEISWAPELPLRDLERTLDQHDPHQAALMQAIRRAGSGAAYAVYKEGVVPWHSAMAATYVHATAPLRRLADRYVVHAALAVANGQAVPDGIKEAFGRLPPVMAKADARAGAIDRAVIDLAEAALLSGKEGSEYEAVAVEVDDRGAKIQLSTLPVVARLAAGGIDPGQPLRVRLVEADVTHRTATFERVATHA